MSPGLIYFRKRFLMGLYKGAYIRVGLYSGGGAYIWNEMSVSTCGGLIHGGGGGLYSGGGL
jgi:hypothetical protein